MKIPLDFSQAEFLFGTITRKIKRQELTFLASDIYLYKLVLLDRLVDELVELCLTLAE
jgi:hypothetical protein